MKSILGIALLAMILSMLLTPLVKRAALWLGLVDQPDKRKVHRIPMPRVGGVAIFLGCIFAFLPAVVMHSDVLDMAFLDPRVKYLICGGVMMFGLGFVDDIWGLKARFKLGVQAVSALILFMGGIKIAGLGIKGVASFPLGWTALPISVFWVLIVVNAVNLIDGLDGLAAGVGVFVCCVLVMLNINNNNLLEAMIMASLCGAILGFLWYNFNPATIFMGDSGSYFIGYMIAALSMMGSTKTQTAATLLIPVIALGIPLMDTVWATIRRFVVGRGLFTPDKDHFHHRLLKMGLSHRTAVLVLYSVSIVMGLAALSLVFLNDARTSILLALLFIGCVMGIKKLGYLDFLTPYRVSRWGKGIVDEVGLNKDRRILHAHQLAISTSENLETFWENVIQALKFLNVDYAKIQLWEGHIDPQRIFYGIWHLKENTKDEGVLFQYNRLLLKYPFERNGIYFGNIILSKEGFDSDHSKYLTLSHVEHLRRTMSEKLAELRAQGKFNEVAGRTLEVVDSEYNRADQGDKGRIVNAG